MKSCKYYTGCRALPTVEEYPGMVVLEMFPTFALRNFCSYLVVFPWCLIAKRPLDTDDRFSVVLSQCILHWKARRDVASIEL